MVHHTTAKQKFILFCFFSTVAASTIVYKAFSERPSFYAACISLSHGLNAIFLANWFLLLAVGVGKMFQTILFGELRIIEIEHIYERAWFTITNSLVAIAMFRNEQILLLATLTLFQLFMKVFHWILKDRMNFHQQRAQVAADILKVRTFWLISVFILLDYSISKAFLDRSFISSADVYVIFGLDFALSTMDLLVYKLKILLNMYEMVYFQDTEEEIWELKTLFVKYLDIMHSLMRVFIHVLLFYVLMGPYRMPIHIFRGTFLSVKALFKQLADLKRYLRAAKELDTLLADAQEEELERDNLCIICREDMTTIGIVKGARSFPKKLPCNHIIHMGCLKDWLERSQSCPMCRQPVFNNPNNANVQPNQNNGNNENENININADENNEEMNRNEENVIIDDGIRVRPVAPEDTMPTGRSFNEIPQPDPLHDSDYSHSIRLSPSNALLPTDWSILPLTRISKSNYQVHLTTNTRATLKVLPQESSTRLNFITPESNEHAASEFSESVDRLQDELNELRMQIFPTSGSQGSHVCESSESITRLKDEIDKLKSQLQELQVAIDRFEEGNRVK